MIFLLFCLRRIPCRASSLPEQVSFDPPTGCMIPTRIQQSILTNEAQVGGICPLTLLVTADEALEFSSRLQSRLRALPNPSTARAILRSSNCHGAFISTAIALRVGMTIDIRVVLTGKCARATVVYVNREQPRLCGVALDQSQNIWGMSLPRMTGLKQTRDEMGSYSNASVANPIREVGFRHRRIRTGRRGFYCRCLDWLIM